MRATRLAYPDERTIRRRTGRNAVPGDSDALSVGGSSVVADATRLAALQSLAGNRAVSAALRPERAPGHAAPPTHVQRMLWVIEPKEKELTEEQDADLNRLKENKRLPDTDFANKELSFSVGHAEKPVAARVPNDKDIHVIAHAGLEDAPWIGGMYFPKFADALVKKYGRDTLEGGSLWLLVCHAGQALEALAKELGKQGLKNVAIYAPTALMFISSAGIPHVHGDDEADVDEMNGKVAKYEADFLSLSSEGFQAAGAGWAGCRLEDGAPAKMKASKVSEAVRDKFDPDEDES